jgi:enoyl-CoA hydratase
MFSATEPDPDDPYRRDEFGMYPFRGPFPPRTKLLIGAINGPAITGGFELALSCDFLVASERARFADTHARVGIMPGWGLTVLLAEAIGVRRAKELSTTGNFLDAATALQWGLVNHVVPHEELLPRARKLATDIAGNDQAGVRRMLRTYDEGYLMTRDGAWDLEGKVSHEWLAGRADLAAQVEERRGKVMERGRSQSG